MQTPRPITKPSKQRKAIYQAPAHIRHKLLSAHLSPQLRASHLIRNLPVRTGDTVKVMRGDHTNVEGKISRVDLLKYRIYVEGLTREKVDGTTIPVPVHPSKVMITRLNLDDKWRREILETKKKSLKKRAEVEEKPKAKRPEIEKAVEVEEPEEIAEEIEEKPEEIVEKVKETVEEKAPVKAKPAKKKVARAKKPVAKKEVVEKAKPKTKAEEPEKKEKPKEKKKPKSTKEKTRKKTKEGEE